MLHKDDYGNISAYHVNLCNLFFFRRRILAKQLGDFVRVYGKVKCTETEKFSREIRTFLLTIELTVKHIGNKKIENHDLRVLLSELSELTVPGFR